MTLSRRRFLITGMAAGAAGTAWQRMGDHRKQQVLVWQGAAMGGEARVSLFGADRDGAQRALEETANEIERLENIFSLYRPSSEVSRLNREGTLFAPSRDLVGVVRAAIEWRKRTQGAFDPTIQPLWQAAAAGREVTPAVLGLAGTPIDIAPDRLTLQTGARLTFNGIAQGRIADRVTEVLSSHGFTDVVVDAGELRLPGTTCRTISLPATGTAVRVARVAIATSEPRGLVFEPVTNRHHLIDPRTGLSPQHWRSITVFAPMAEIADALSTAFSVLPADAVADLAASIHDVAVIGADMAGTIWKFGNQRLIGA